MQGSEFFYAPAFAGLEVFQQISGTVCHLLHLLLHTKMNHIVDKL